MSRSKHIPVMMFMLVVVLFFVMVGCTAPVSNRGCEMLEDELERANAELAKLRSELDKVDAEVAVVNAASLEELLQQRRSTRQYSDAPLTRDEVMKLLWAGQGVTNDRGFRTAPSAGALYPLELYVVAGNVDNLAPGIYSITYNEIVHLPENIMALATPRSSLLRCGVTVNTAVWDAGYSGRSQSLLVVYNPQGFQLQRNARIIQLVFFRLGNQTEGYSGTYQNENID